MLNILLVEDEKNFGMVLKDYLRMNGYAVELCENGELGIEQFRKNKFDLCILDIMMPKKDGFTLSSEIRAIDNHVPFIFLTARGQKEDMVKGYKNGADDYIVKPFDSELLLLKIQALLKRKQYIEPEHEHLYDLGLFNFNAKLRLLKHKEGTETKLSPKESALLHLLCRKKNDVLSRESALKEIWKEDNYFTGRSMDVYIVKLRKYLSADPRIEINNLHGNGYCLLIRQQE
ncbi:MAG: response regulator transcription factor [Bacteroidia bacterium]|nr:response regulator transcription factor [Bacteroidia bacterium]